MLRRTLAAGLALVAAAALAGCGASSVSGLEPAKHANDPACADVVVRLPDSVGGEARRWTDAQGTGAWGSPATVLLTCGLDAPGPSTLQCVEISGVDWLVDDSKEPNYRLTTFGRTPAVELFVDSSVDETGQGVSPNDVLRDLARAVDTLPTNGRACTSPAELPEG